MYFKCHSGVLKVYSEAKFSIVSQNLNLPFYDVGSSKKSKKKKSTDLGVCFIYVP